MTESAYVWGIVGHVLEIRDDASGIMSRVYVDEPRRFKVGDVVTVEVRPTGGVLAGFGEP